MHAATAPTSAPATPANAGPLCTYPWTGPRPTEIPAVLVRQLRERLHHKQVKAILAPPLPRDSQRELLRDACAMVRKGIHEADAAYVLRVRFESYDRPIDEREIERAVTKAGVLANSIEPPGPRFPRPDSALVAAVLEAAPADALAVLRESSPTKNPDKLTAGSVIDRLFGCAGDTLLCLGTAKNKAVTEARAFFSGEDDEYPFIVANAMSARHGRTQDGRPSVRSLTNVGPRQNVVVEFDGPTLDEQAAFHLHLRGFASLRAVVFSGSKSLHGWYDARGSTAEQIQNFLCYAARLGSDTATLNPVQFVRTPNAWRDNDAHQTVEYLEAPSTATRPPG